MPEENEQFEKERLDKIWLDYEKSQAEGPESLNAPPEIIIELNEKSRTEGPPAESPQIERSQAERPVILADHIKEETEYLEETLNEYEKYVLNIGNLKYTAAMLLYFRDDIQESLDFLKPYADLKEYWKKVVYLDNILRGKAGIFVKEVGYHNFKQYQIVNDPPKLYWWWYLNKQVSAPPKEKKWWQVWR